MMPDEAARAASKKRAGKAAPVLPWMRVPVAIEASEGTPLDEVQGLDPRLRTALEGGRTGCSARLASSQTLLGLLGSSS